MFIVGSTKLISYKTNYLLPHYYNVSELFTYIYQLFVSNVAHFYTFTLLNKRTQCHFLIAVSSFLAHSYTFFFIKNNSFFCISSSSDLFFKFYIGSRSVCIIID